MYYADPFIQQKIIRRYFLGSEAGADRGGWVGKTLPLIVETNYTAGRVTFLFKWS